jgi:uncharacterized protein YyaL (SSP411 family)
VANALLHESSPYLRQHAHNPVDWLPWGPEAFERARARGVPVLVSIGYSSCHWCHVMERESFEDEATARVMNEEYVCVKVDREERPDVDALYMEAVQGMTGHGGWPLNVFLTPEAAPFYGGTYFPPRERPGMPAFTQVLQAVAEAWRARGEEIAAAGARLREQLSGAARLQPSAKPIEADALEQAVTTLQRSFDTVHGGFGGAPKFPQASVIEFLLCRAAAHAADEAGSGVAAGTGGPARIPRRDAAPAEASETPAAAMALYTLRSMASGGIHDQVGGGFHRYSVDANWTVPHFEKMLYDNALLARAYLHGFQISGDPRFEEVCRDTLDWALREMRGPEGGFYSALDADSEGVEGRFYVWTLAELRQALEAGAGAARDAEAAIRWLGATEQGNFQDPHHPEPGQNVLEDRDRSALGQPPDEHLRKSIRERLLHAREERARPGLDDKRLTGWNALTVTALADAGAVLAESRYLGAGVRCAEFVLGQLRDDQGRLLRAYNDGRGRIAAYLEDHAFLLEALIVLFEATCEERWLHEATALADTLIERFGDAERGGFFTTASDGEALIARRKDIEDSPIPSGSSSASMGLARLAELTGERRYEREAVRAIALAHELAPRHPEAFGHLLQAIHWHLAPMRPVACELPRSAGRDPLP